MLEPESKLRLLHFHAPGGFGKTTLLREIARRFSGGLVLQRVDATALAADRDQVGRTISAAAARLAEAPQGLLLIDGLEHHRALEPIYAQQWLPSLPRQTRVVTAGRLRLSQAFAIDPAWAMLCRQLPLEQLDAEQSQALLQRRGVPSEDLGSLAAAGCGHPLTLACLSMPQAQVPAAVASPQPVRGELQLPELDSTLVRSNAAVLALLTLVPELTQGLLAGLAPNGLEAAEAFLCNLPFAEPTGRGFRCHDLYRDELLARLRVLASGELEALRTRAILWHAGELERASTYSERIALASAWPYLLRGRDVTGTTLADLGQHPHYWDRLRPEDELPLNQACERFFGAEEARIARHHRALRPALSSVLRDTLGAPAAFLQWVAGDEVSSDDLTADPVLAQLHSKAMLQGTLLVRHWGSLSDGTETTPARAELVARSAAEAFAHRNIKRYLIAVRQLDPVTRYLQQGYLLAFPELECEVDGARLRFAGYSFEERSPSDWMRAAIRQTPPPPSASMNDAVWLRRVREALRRHHDDARLAECELARLVAAERSTVERAQQVRAVLESALGQLPEAPEPSARELIVATFLGNGGKQLEIADELGLTYTTYRRKLRIALDNLAARVQQTMVESA